VSLRRLDRSPGSVPWRTLLVSILFVVVVVESTVLLTGHTLVHGTYDLGFGGSVAEWIGGVATAGAVVAAILDVRKRQHETVEAERRAEALKITAWVTWSQSPLSSEIVPANLSSSSVGSGQSPETAPDPRQVIVLNDSSSAVFDWTVVLVPSTRWDSYVSIPAAIGPLIPAEPKAVPLRAPPQEVVLKRKGKESDNPYGVPRFVVLTFNDAWGTRWIRTNGDIQRSPQESQFLPRLIHLRHPGMKWAGILDEATWEAFLEAAGSPPGLSQCLSGLRKGDKDPWFEKREIEELNRKINCHPLQRRGTYEYRRDKRGIVRRIKRKDAFDEVRRFFDHVANGGIGSILYVEGD
jgi:hypothetical protein